MQSGGARQSSSSSAGHPTAPEAQALPPPDAMMGFTEQPEQHQNLFVPVGAHVTTQSPTVYHSFDQSAERVNIDRTLTADL